MLAIKLKRVGKKHQATFRIVVQEKREKVNGRFVDDLGFWNPHTNELSIKKEVSRQWMKNGAQPTATVHNLLIKAKVLEGTKKIQLHRKPKKPEAVS